MSEREFVDYRGERFWLQTTGAYFQSGRKEAPERLLHRRVYIDNFGPIPPGFDVHHKDDNWRNSDPGNLEAILQADHRRQHMAARWASPVTGPKLYEALDRARELAKAWHASPEGLAWHRANGVAAWEDREPITAVCEHCGEGFQAWVSSRARFCGRACAQRAGRSKVFCVPTDCRICGANYMASKYNPSSMCSRECQGVAKRGIPRDATT